ncbi:ribonuclease H-like domain-containing protein [Tanacetum coccineum]
MASTKPSSCQFLDNNLDTSTIALRLLTTPTSPQQTPPLTTPQTTPQTNLQTTPPTPLSTPSPQTTLTPLITLPPPPPPPPTSQHPMVTHSKVRIVKVNLKYNLHVTTPPLSSSLHSMPCEILTGNKLCVTNIKLSSTITLSYAIRASFYHSKTDSSLFIFHKGPDTAYLLLYVDDIILTDSSTSLMQRIISSLHAKFAMTDLGPLNYFLGKSATHTAPGIFLSQMKYATDILERAHMLNCNPCRTLVDIEKKLRPEGSPVTDPTLYHSLFRALQYLTFTRPDLSYAVQQLCLYMHDPREPHLNQHLMSLQSMIPQSHNILPINKSPRYLLGTTKSWITDFRSTTHKLFPPFI